MSTDEQWWADFADEINDPEVDLRIGAAEDGRALSDAERAAIERFRAGEPSATPAAEEDTNG